MPFYEYQCSACRAHVEVLQKVSDAPLRKCPECGKQKLTRLLSAPVFRLKGGGWYETDFKSDKETKRNLADGAGGESADSGGDATAKPAETKSEAKAATATPAAAPAKPKGASKPKPAKTKPAAKTPAKARSGRR